MTPNPNPWGEQNSYTELDGYAQEYRPEHAFKAGIDTLPDGNHDCVIESAQMDRVQGDLIVRVALKLASGAKVEWTHWLNKQTGVNALCADLASLGFDADRWGPAYNRPLSQEIPRAVAKLAGIKFRGAKTSRTGKAVVPGQAPPTYHDFRAVCRITGQPMPPSNPPVQTPAPAQGSAGPNGTGSVQSYAGVPDNEIPF